MVHEERSSWFSKVSASVWTAIIAPVLVGLILYWLGVGRSDPDRQVPVVASPVNAPTTTTPASNEATGTVPATPTAVNSPAPGTPSSGKQKAVSGSLKDF